MWNCGYYVFGSLANKNTLKKRFQDWLNLGPATHCRSLCLHVFVFVCPFAQIFIQIFVKIIVYYKEFMASMQCSKVTLISDNQYISSPVSSAILVENFLKYLSPTKRNDWYPAGGRAGLNWGQGAYPVQRGRLYPSSSSSCITHRIYFGRIKQYILMWM